MIQDACLCHMQSATILGKNGAVTGTRSLRRNGNLHQIGVHISMQPQGTSADMVRIVLLWIEYSMQYAGVSFQILGVLWSRHLGRRMQCSLLSVVS